MFPGTANSKSLRTTFYTKAKNEQDPMALAALRKSLKLQPNNLEAILSIAASFTNESYQAHACHALQGRRIISRNHSSACIKIQVT